MGDVYDAMNRSRRGPAPAASDDRPVDPGSTDPTVADAASQPEASNDDAPSLPIDAVNARPLAEEDPQTSANLSRREPGWRGSVAQAADKLTDATGAADDPDEPVAMEPDPTLAGGQDPDARKNGYNPAIIVHHDRGSVITEQYRAIRTQVLARCRTKRLQAFVVTSATPSEGKSVTTFNLGVAFTELREKKTLIIEADLRRPSFGRLLGRELTPGLIQHLRGEEKSFRSCVYPTVYDNLFVLPAGGDDHMGSTELLSSDSMARTLQEARDQFDYIFIDTPPVITVTDACILGTMVDEVFMVIRLHHTAVDAVDRAKRLLKASNCEPSGVILTHVEPRSSPYMSKYAYRYKYRR